jgi:hypothetical protein
MNPKQEKPKKAKASPSQLARGVIKSLAGVSVSSPKDLIKIAAHAGDLMLKRDFSTALADTYAFFIHNGSIDTKYFDTTNFADLAPEFKTVLNGDFGVSKLDALRKIFTNLAKDNGKNSHKKYLLDIALEMSEPEIKTLIADHAFIVLLPEMKNTTGLIETQLWLAHVAKISGLKHDSLVRAASDRLIERGLFGGYVYGDNSAVRTDDTRSRLTTMGLELYELMQVDDDPFKKTFD